MQSCIHRGHEVRLQNLGALVEQREVSDLYSTPLFGGCEKASVDLREAQHRGV